MLNNILSVIYGFILIIVGIAIMNGVKIQTGKLLWNFDFAPLNVLLGALMIIIGLLSIWAGLRKIKKIDKK